ncbi:MAG: amidohydrolase family protein, partial [Acidimicrobiia bacterium]|nr:amidohydrolase family protein [Acidimicrobiia bacterium]
VGNCGFSAAPRDPELRFAASMHPGYPIPDFEGFGGYVGYVDANPPGVNIGVLAGHGSIRAAAMGRTATDPKHQPSPSELSTMIELLNEGLDAGVLGLSTGLVYQPGRNATTDELVAVASVMAGTGALYATHMRDEGDRLVESVAEAIDIGRRAGVPVQVSHHKAAGPANWGKVVQSLALIDQARAEGLVVNADQYPYTAGSTTLESVLDNYRIVDDDHPESGATDGATLPGSRLVVASCETKPEWEGRSMRELGAMFGSTADQASRTVLDAAPTATVILHMMDEADVRTVMIHPSTVIGSDGLPTLDGRPHPRLYNTFARVLGHYARDLNLLSMAEAVARMTGRSAEIFGLADRGYLRPGYAADVVVFDPVTIIDRGTFTDPNHHPDGIQQVFVNGEAVVSDGDPTGARPGQVLRRSGAVKAGGRSWPDRAEPRVEPASSARPRSRQTEETR